MRANSATSAATAAPATASVRREGATAAQRCGRPRRASAASTSASSTKAPLSPRTCHARQTGVLDLHDLHQHPHSDIHPDSPPEPQNLRPSVNGLLANLAR